MHVFVYGTLTEPERVARLVDSYVFVGSAVCEGLHPVEGTYPTLAPGGAVAGRLLRTEEIHALDEYEGVDEGLYVRVSLPYRGPGPDTVETYVGDPAALDVPAGASDVSAGVPDVSTGASDVSAADSTAADSSAGKATFAGGDPSGGDDAPAADPVGWPGDGSFAQRVARYVERERPFVRPIEATDGRPTGV